MLARPSPLRSPTEVTCSSGALASSAYTYQDFSADDMKAYAEALEHPNMRLVYELMNAVHYQVMGDRFAALALRLGELQPSQDL